MYIVKYHCRYNNLGGEFPPVAFERAQPLVELLAGRFQDYCFWLEQAS